MKIWLIINRVKGLMKEHGHEPIRIGLLNFKFELTKLKI